MGFLNVNDPEVGVTFCGEKVGKVEKTSRGLGCVSRFPKERKEKWEKKEEKAEKEEKEDNVGRGRTFEGTMKNTYGSMR